MHTDALIFDLDGTLWDTCAACAIGWNRVIARLGIRYRTMRAEDVRKVAGKTHIEAIALSFSDLSPAQIEAIARDTAEEDNRAVAAEGPMVDHGGVDPPRLRPVEAAGAGYIRQHQDGACRMIARHAVGERHHVRAAARN